jgi:ABC-type amino acid transport substrate-binding protein
VRLATSRLDEVAPALLRGEGDLALLDVADAVLAFETWPGHFKVIGPVSPVQDMAAAFRKDSPRLRAAFDRFLAGAVTDGTYARLVKTYFPTAPELFPPFFARAR